MSNITSMKVHNDNRGQHIKFFEKAFAEGACFNEVNEIFMTVNNYGTVRGFHFQQKPTQQKVVKPINGRFNVKIVSPFKMSAYGDPSQSTDKWYLYEFDNIDETHTPLFVPGGAMLGYVALEDNSKMLYIADAPFCAEGDTGYSPIKNGSLIIDWKIPNEDIILSEKDKQLEPIP